jgi:hypothetical protein
MENGFRVHKPSKDQKSTLLISPARGADYLARGAGTRMFCARRISLREMEQLRFWTKNHFSSLKITYLNSITFIQQIPSIFMDKNTYSNS